MAAIPASEVRLEVGVVAARHDPDLERRARCERGERDRVVVLPDEAVRTAWLVTDEAAPRALALADHEPRGAAELLRDPVRDLGQVVQVEAEVVRPGAGLAAPVLDDLEVLGLAGGPGLGEGGPGAREEAHDRLVADGVEGAVLAGRGDDRPPRAARPGVGERDLGDAVVELAGLLVGADDMEREVLEGPEPDAVAGRQPAVLAVAAVVDLVRGPGEPVAMEGAIDDRRDPPAGDRVLAQLEQAGSHLSAPPRGPRSAPRRGRGEPARGRRRRPGRAGPPRSGRERASRRPPRRPRSRPSSRARRPGPPRARSRSRRLRASRTASIRSKSARSGSTFRAIP